MLGEVVMAEHECSAEELEKLASEFANTVSIDGATYDKARPEVLDAARRLVETSTETHTILIPDNAQSIEEGHGGGEWVAALVYIPNNQIV